MTHISFNMKTIHGNLFESKEIYGFAGNVNCVTVKGHGFTSNASNALGKWCDPYSWRTAVVSKAGNTLNLCIETQRFTPGDIFVQQNTDEKAPIQYAIWLVAQLEMSYPGRFPARFMSKYKDTYLNRELWFQQSLDKCGEWCQNWSKTHENKKFRLGMSDRTGCGLGGGDVKKYQQFMQEFATKYSDNVELIWFVHDG